MIVQELDVARHEFHVEPQFGVSCQFGRHIKRFDVLRREPTRLGKSLRRTDV
jgi:hypothetical protein